MNIIGRIKDIRSMCSLCSSLKSNILDTNKKHGTEAAIQVGLDYDGLMCGSVQEIVRLCRKAKEDAENQSTGPVCDRIFRCYGWEKNYRSIIVGDLFKFCPWCGKEIKR